MKKVIIICVFSILAVSSSWAAPDRGNGLRQTINTNSFFSISIPTNNARVIGLFITTCNDSSCVASLNTVRLGSLTERAKPQIICADSVCSPLERDIVTVSVGADVGTAFGLSGGYAGVADAEVAWQLDVGIGGGMEFDIKGAMKIKPARNSEFQSGGNLLADSGFGATMFSDHVMVGTKRFFGVTGNANFYGEKSPESHLMVGALGRDGVPACVDESSNTVVCTAGVVSLLQSLCNDQSRCLDTPGNVQTAAVGDTESRFGGFSQEELNDAMEEAKNVVDMLKADIRDRAITSRLADIRELFEQLRDSDTRQSLRDELQGSIASELEEVLAIVTSNTRFPEIDLARIERLPEAQDITEAVAELLNPLLAVSGETASQTSAKTKAKFCATTLGQRRAFNAYCGR